MRKKAVLIGCILAVALPATLVMATENKITADDVLAMVDENLLKVEDSTYLVDLSVVRSKKVVKTMQFKVILKGLFKKHITFLAPGDLAGTAIVTTDDKVTYVYMPAYGKVRRVASHVNNQGFMGTDISGEELGSAALSEGWKASIIKDDDTDWTLKLVPDGSNNSTFSKMIVTVSKAYRGVVQIDSYNAEGKKVKTQVRTNWKAFSDDSGKTSVTMPTEFTVTDHLTGSKTQMKFTECKVNQHVSDSIFTRRALMRGN
ncbi:MAG: outer membrane lipoprotein-sorting protein [Deltaproteobacteria bacterium]|nr:outer membrane lipoprotein-sorting protein [Deltaproteobacteria bacterium]